LVIASAGEQEYDFNHQGLNALIVASNAAQSCVTRLLPVFQRHLHLNPKTRHGNSTGKLDEETGWSHTRLLRRDLKTSTDLRLLNERRQVALVQHNGLVENIQCALVVIALLLHVHNLAEQCRWALAELVAYTHV
jgi:hypothetical protein